MDERLLDELETVQAERSQKACVIASLLADGVDPSAKLLDEFRQLTAQSRYLLARLDRQVTAP